tara:strand:- start:1250 stop:1594 length:345 start_codon:yes stop_codon:yes gene_type:complete
LITNEGKKDIATTYIKTYYRVIKIGEGGSATSAAQTDLDNYVATASSEVTPDVVGSTLIWNVDFLGSQVPSSGITEIGVFHNTTDKLLTRVTFTSTGAVAASDTVSFRVKLEVN